MEVVMKSRMPLLALAVGLLAAGTIVGSLAIADSAKDAKSALPEIKLPPGWTMEDMETCMKAATPGKNQQLLSKDAGVWQGKTTMWMGPDGDAMHSECTSTVTPIMDGRYIKVEIKGDMPGMGPFEGFGIYGYDNVSGQFVASWVDNQSTGIMNGTGELSKDGKTLTWKNTFNCPLNKKPAVMREIDTITGPNSKTLEMIGNDPKSGKEFKMMRIELTREK
jgi:hypothetical protein